MRSHDLDATQKNKGQDISNNFLIKQIPLLLK